MMTDHHSLVETLHQATHRLAGVTEHEDRPAGHQGKARHGRAAQGAVAGRGRSGQARDRTSARPPRVLVAWQRRVAAFFGQEV